jgi:hypothetical protein
MVTSGTRAVAAYGGAERWQSAQCFCAEVSTHGLAFTIKRRPVFTRARIEGHVHRPYCRLTPIGHAAGITDVLDGTTTRLETETGLLARHGYTATVIACSITAHSTAFPFPHGDA